MKKQSKRDIFIIQDCDIMLMNTKNQEKTMYVK